MLQSYYKAVAIQKDLGKKSNNTGYYRAIIWLLIGGNGHFIAFKQKSPPGSDAGGDFL